jgi:ATP-binding protein involved in chromosome partitioning
MVDPRMSVIDRRMKRIRNIIAVSSGKGGVGKSLVASTIALTLAKKGKRVGLFDLDFTSPSTHLILKVKDETPQEEKGIIPPQIYGLKYMSIVYFSGEHVSPLRGKDLSNVLIELLAITRWGKLDFLIIDMPPAISDITLDVIRLVKRIQMLIVTTSSKLSFETVKKLITLLSNLEIPIIGVIENMKIHDTPFIKRQVESKDIHFLGEIPFDLKLEEAIGNVERFLQTDFANKVEKIMDKKLSINQKTT